MLTTILCVTNSSPIIYDKYTIASKRTGNPVQVLESNSKFQVLSLDHSSLLSEISEYFKHKQSKQWTTIYNLIKQGLL